MVNKFYLVITIIPFMISLILIAVIFLGFKYLPSTLPLFYSLPWGERQLVSQYAFYIIPSTIILITFINLVISTQLHQTQIFLKKGLLLSSLVITLILTITFLKIIFIFI